MGILEDKYGGQSPTDQRKEPEARELFLLKTQIGAANDENAELHRENAALRNIVTGFMACMNRFGDWEDGCFYYNQKAASELQAPLRLHAEISRRP